MKITKILLIFLISICSFGQVSNGSETDFDYGIKNNAAQTVTVPINIVTQGTDGTYGKALPANLPISYAVIDSLKLKKDATSTAVTSTVTLTNNGTTFTLSAFTGVIVNNSTVPATRTAVNFAGAVNVTPLYQLSLLYVDNTGTLQQANGATADLTQLQKVDNIYIGRVVFNSGVILALNLNPSIEYGIDNRFRNLGDKIRNINEGNNIGANGANLQINKGAGTTWRVGSNFANDRKVPDETTDIAATPIPAGVNAIGYRNGSGGWTYEPYTGSITPTFWDNGTGTKATVANNKFTNHRVYFFNATDTYIIYLGRAEYSTLEAAKLEAEKPNAIVDPATAVASLIGTISVEKSCTALNNTALAAFTQGPRMQGGASSGGTSGTQNLQSTYLNSLQPQITTTSTLGAVDFQRGSASDTDYVTRIKNGAGTVTAGFTGNGALTATGYNGYTPENVANKSDSYTASSSTTYASTKALVDGLGIKANDTDVVHKTGTETITGIKNITAKLGLNESTPLAQLHLANHTVNEGINWGTLSGGNQSIQVQGTLDATTATSDVAGMFMNYNTVGTNANIDGLMINLKPGFTGNKLVRGINVHSMVAGARQLDLLDESGTIGGSFQSQGASTGDNVGSYNIAGFAAGLNVASFNRAMQDVSSSSYSTSNIGVIGYAGHHLPIVSNQIGGYFAIGHDYQFAIKPHFLESAALIADNGDFLHPIFKAKQYGTDVFKIDTYGQTTISPSLNSTIPLYINAPTGQSTNLISADIASVNKFRISQSGDAVLAGRLLFQENAGAGTVQALYSESGSNAVVLRAGSTANLIHIKRADATTIASINAVNAGFAWGQAYATGAASVPDNSIVIQNQLGVGASPSSSSRVVIDASAGGFNYGLDVTSPSDGVLFRDPSGYFQLGGGLFRSTSSNGLTLQTTSATGINLQTNSVDRLTISPTGQIDLLGTPTAPTAAPGTNTTQIATMAAVQAANSDNVKLTGDQTISGTKTFISPISSPQVSVTGGLILLTGSSNTGLSSPNNGGAIFQTQVGVSGWTSNFPITSPTPSLGGHLTNKGYVDGLISALPTHADVVHKSGTETITGLKTFSLPVIIANGTVSNEAVNKGQLDAIKPYKSYTALLTQTGTSAPIATVLENTLGGTVIWTRNSTGLYTGTLDGAFVSSKTYYPPSSSTFVNSNVRIYNYILNTSQVRIDTAFLDTFSDGILSNTTVELRVYN